MQLGVDAGNRATEACSQVQVNVEQGICSHCRAASYTVTLWLCTSEESSRWLLSSVRSCFTSAASASRSAFMESIFSLAT